VRFTVPADFSGWNVELEVSPDRCAKVRQVPFSDVGAPERVLAVGATIDVSVIPESTVELETMGGQLVATFEDGVRFLAQF